MWGYARKNNIIMKPIIIKYLKLMLLGIISLKFSFYLQYHSERVGIDSYTMGWPFPYYDKYAFDGPVMYNNDIFITDVLITAIILFTFICVLLILFNKLPPLFKE
jgi:hypothetical protein